MSRPFHVTAAIPYVNAKPHLGHVLEWFQADTIARYRRLLGDDVSFVSGTDENSLKNVQAAESADVPIQEWLDQYAQIFQEAFSSFDISLTGFGRGSDQVHHWPGVQELWKRCDAAGDIYTKRYQGLYCTGCEAFYTQADLVDGCCPEHRTAPEVIEEENYFFRLSKYQDQIRSLIADDRVRIVSDQFKKEMLGFIDQGLEDFSVSRSVDRARGVGVPVPNDPSQVMYVWFDALSMYMTSIGFGHAQGHWEKYWRDAAERVHVIGKGINRFHSVYWLGMLLSADLPLPTTISVHGYITVDGQKMSKSLGNVIEPHQFIAQYGLEPVRFYLLKYIPTHADGDIGVEKFTEVYTADLANGIGNLCSRVAKMMHNIGGVVDSADQEPSILEFLPEFAAFMENYELSQALSLITDMVRALDGYLSEHQPWKQVGAQQQQTLAFAVRQLQIVAYHLQPFLPQTASSILDHFHQRTITPMPPLFPRI